MLNEKSIENLSKTSAFLYNHLYPLAAIWLDEKLNVVREGRKVPTVRMALTDNVKVVDGVITDATNGSDATHEITKLLGTNRKDNNEFEISGRNLLTDEIETIKLPL